MSDVCRTCQFYRQTPGLFIGACTLRLPPFMAANYPPTPIVGQDDGCSFHVEAENPPPLVPRFASSRDER